MVVRIFQKLKCVVVLVFLNVLQNTYSAQHSFWSQPSFTKDIENVTVSAGRDVTLSCDIENLGNYRVAWFHKERGTVLSIQNRVIIRNSRFRVTNNNLRIWYLHIKAVTEDDAGQYSCQINTWPMISQIGFLQVVVSPYIDEETRSEIDVREGEGAFMKCSARGSPAPDVKWRRQDNMGIPMLSCTGKEKYTVPFVQGEYLNLTKTSRLNTGVYLCTASNGIPPKANKRITLRVNFPPMVWIPNQLVGAPVGSEVALDCNLESNPHPVTFWMKETGQVVISGSNYNIITTTSGYYKLQMKLVIRNISSEDFGYFICVAKNTLGETAGKIRVYEIPTALRKESDEISQTPNTRDFGIGEDEFRLKENNSGEDKSSNLLIHEDSINSDCNYLHSSILILFCIMCCYCLIHTV